MADFVIPIAIFVSVFSLIVFAVLGAIVIKISQRNAANRQARLLYSQPLPLQTPGTGTFEETLKSEFDAGICNQVQVRLQQESQPGRGEHVWVLHHIWNGQLKHWALLTHGHQYELRRAVAESQNAVKYDVEEGLSIKDGWASVGGWGRRYEYRIQPRRVDEERHKAAVSRPNSLTMDGFYMSLVGWTHKTKAEVDAICQSTVENHGFYNPFRDMDLALLRSLASQIAMDKADGWGWFYPSPVPNDKYVQYGSFGGPAVVVAEWLHRLKQMRPFTQIQDRGNLEAKIERHEKFLDMQRGAFVLSRREAWGRATASGGGGGGGLGGHGGGLADYGGNGITIQFWWSASNFPQPSNKAVQHRAPPRHRIVVIIGISILTVTVSPSAPASIRKHHHHRHPHHHPNSTTRNTHNMDSSDAASTFSGSTACSYTKDKDAPPAAEAKAARRGVRQRVRDVVHELGRPPTAKQDAKDGKTTQNHIEVGPTGAGIMRPGNI
ncbi:hypothetical protein EDB81DRAFT_949926 [Dactylonectria macrodidyma]|uniref:Uncharacterized protein n=1 Tax=Dactylonectria macrodidyma TaxID=307937 RepID=A0A9P9EAI8_9HYPO|nr:hypothetical protein EDB81DRAFT_949926 [Dactylonectria macrodidyma]